MNYNDEFLRLVAESVETHGVSSQLNIAKRELAELIVAISRLECLPGNDACDVSTGISSVELNLERLKYILQRDYGCEPSHFVWQKYFIAGIPLSAHALGSKESEAANE